MWSEANAALTINRRDIKFYAELTGDIRYRVSGPIWPIIGKPARRRRFVYTNAIGESLERVSLVSLFIGDYVPKKADERRAKHRPIVFLERISFALRRHLDVLPIGILITKAHYRGGALENTAPTR